MGACRTAEALPAGLDTVAQRPSKIAQPKLPKQGADTARPLQVTNALPSAWLVKYRQQGLTRSQRADAADWQACNYVTESKSLIARAHPAWSPQHAIQQILLHFSCFRL